LRSGLISENVNALLLEKLISSKLECSLQEVPSTCRTKTGQKSAGTLTLNDLLEATNKTTIVGNGIKLNAGFYNINGCQRTVGNTTADSAGESEAGI